MYALILDALDLAATVVMVGAAVWFTLVAAKARDRAEATLQQAQELAAVLDRRLSDLRASQMGPGAGPLTYQYQNEVMRLEEAQRASKDASTLGTGFKGLDASADAIRLAREARERAATMLGRIPSTPDEEDPDS